MTETAPRQALKCCGNWDLREDSGGQLSLSRLRLERRGFQGTSDDTFDVLPEGAAVPALHLEAGHSRRIERGADRSRVTTNRPAASRAGEIGARAIDGPIGEGERLNTTRQHSLQRPNAIEKLAAPRIGGLIGKGKVIDAVGSDRHARNTGQALQFFGQKRTTASIGGMAGPVDNLGQDVVAVVERRVDQTHVQQIMSGAPFFERGG